MPYHKITYMEDGVEHTYGAFDGKHPFTPSPSTEKWSSATMSISEVRALADEMSKPSEKN